MEKKTVRFQIKASDSFEKAFVLELGKLKLHNRKHEKLRVGIACLCLVGLWCCTAWLAWQVRDTAALESGILSAAVLIIHIFYLLLMAAVSICATVYLLYGRVWLSGKSKLRRIAALPAYSFYDEEFAIETAEGGTGHFSYAEDIWEAIYEGQWAFYIKILEANYYLVLKKDCFVIGEREQFLDFAEKKFEKTGKRIK